MFKMVAREIGLDGSGRDDIRGDAARTHLTGKHKPEKDYSRVTEFLVVATVVFSHFCSYISER
jgi:hypothetical protein